MLTIKQIMRRRSQNFKVLSRISKIAIEPILKALLIKTPTYKTNLKQTNLVDKNLSFLPPISTTLKIFTQPNPIAPIIE